jgi:ureidoacrylate peracid hydrolase
VAYEYLGHVLLDDLSEKVAPATTALVVVDMQNDFLHSDGYCARVLGAESVAGFAAVIEPIRRLCDAARDAGVHTVFTRVLQRPDGSLGSAVWFAGTLRYGMEPLQCMEGTWGQEVIEELAPRPGDSVIDKTRRSAFRGTDLEDVLRERGVRSVVCVGVAGCGCVESTIRDALEHDLYVVVARDAVGDNIPQLTAATDTALSLLLDPADVVTTDDVCRIWGATSGGA